MASFRSPSLNLQAEVDEHITHAHKNVVVRDEENGFTKPSYT